MNKSLKYNMEFFISDKEMVSVYFESLRVVIDHAQQHAMFRDIGRKVDTPLFVIDKCQLGLKHLTGCLERVVGAAITQCQKAQITCPPCLDRLSIDHIELARM